MLALRLGLSLSAVLGRAGGSSGPAAPVAAMDPSWTSANAVPIYDLDAAWADQDDLQYEIQTAGGDWSGATVSHHTVTISEIRGVQIAFSGVSLANGNYEVRFKFKHFGGTYSAYSNIVSFTIAAASDDNDYAAWMAAA